MFLGVIGGRGILSTGVPGVLPANVLIIGGCVVGSNAAKTASGFGSKVTVLEINVNTLEHHCCVANMPGSSPAPLPSP